MVRQRLLRTGLDPHCVDVFLEQLNLNFTFLHPSPKCSRIPQSFKKRKMTTRPEANFQDDKTHLILAASASIATIKLPLIISSFEKYSNPSIRVILTKSAASFLAGQSPEQPTVASLALLLNVDSIHQDEDEWVEPWTRDANMLHIELRRWDRPNVCESVS